MRLVHYVIHCLERALNWTHLLFLLVLVHLSSKKTVRIGPSLILRIVDRVLPIHPWYQRNEFNLELRIIKSGLVLVP